MNRICSSCHAVAPAADRYCRSCGATLGVAQGQQTTIFARATTSGPTLLRPSVMTNPFPQAPGWSSSEVGNGSVEHLVFVCDVSYSMDEPYEGDVSKLAAVRRAGRSLVHEKAQRSPADQVGLVVFTEQAHVEVPLVSLQHRKQRLIDALRALTSGPGTDINAGLEAAQHVFDWEAHDVKRRIILLTDGQGGDPLQTAESLKGNGVVIEVIGIGPSPSGVDEHLLRQVASVVGGITRYTFIKDQRTLVRTTTVLAQQPGVQW